MLAAVALSIGVGSFDSPTELQGLPHLLEHMFFGKEQKNSKTEGYLDFISEHGGSTNASTYAEYSSYHFEISGKYLKAALERFANCFITPLIEKKALEAELNAVDSEFFEEIDDLDCILECLRSSTLKESHLYKNIFHSGNKESLMGKEVDCADLQKEVLEFHSKNYHGKKMKLVVIGGEKLDVLERWVLKFFNHIKKGRVPKTTSLPSSEACVLPINPPCIWTSGKKYCVEASDGRNILQVLWALPSLREVYEHKPEGYVSYLLNQEGKGSLISLLKDHGWIVSLNSGVATNGIYSTTQDSIFFISIHLTKSGQDKVDNIIGFIYQYLNLLRGSPQKWIFDEIQTIGNMKFNFEDEKQLDYAIRLSANLLFYPPKHVISANHVCKRWDEQMIKQVFCYLIPENMRVDHVISDFTTVKDVECVPWYKKRYYVDVIDERLMKLWKDNQNFHESLKFPTKNNFIPSDFSLHVGDTCAFPECLVDEDRMKCWYKKDSTFKVPQASIYIRIHFKGACAKARSCVLSKLFLRLLHDKLSEVTSKAQMAMCEITIDFVDGMLELKFFGFNAMLHSLLSDVLREVGSFMPADNIRYNLIKEDLKRYLSNNGNERLRVLLHEHIYDDAEMLGCLDDDFSLAVVKEFIQDIHSQVFIESLFHGNMAKKDADNISNVIKKSFHGNAISIESRHVAERVICLPVKADIVLKCEFDTNNVAEVYFQIGQVKLESVELLALLNLFHVIVEDPFFDKMRRTKNFGYSVTSSLTIIHNVLGFSFKIVSPGYNPHCLQDEIQRFIDEDLEKYLLDLDDTTFENHKSSLVEELLQNFSSLKEESENLWKDITRYRSQFDISQKIAERLKEVKKKHLIKYYRTYFKSSSPNCRRVKNNIMRQGEEMEDEGEEEGQGEETEDEGTLTVTAAVE